GEQQLGFLVAEIGTREFVFGVADLAAVAFHLEQGLEARGALDERGDAAAVTPVVVHQRLRQFRRADGRGRVVGGPLPVVHARAARAAALGGGLLQDDHAGAAARRRNRRPDAGDA